MNILGALLPEWMPNIHPLIIHFPIVLLLLVVLAHLTALVIWKLPWLRTVTLLASVFGFLALIVTYFSGEQAADSVTLPTIAINTLSKHSDLALWTLIYFGVLTILHLGIKFLKIYDKKSVSIVLFVLGVFGFALVIQTADLGGQLVYKYGVGVKSKALVEVDGDEVDGIGSTGFIENDDGSWQLLPSKKISSVFSDDLIWLEGASNDVDAQFKTLDSNEQVIELNIIADNPALFIAGGNLASVQGEIGINLCKFNGTVSLVHHVQDKMNYDYFSIADDKFKLGRVENGIDEIISEKSATHDCSVDLRVVGDGRHFRGYLNNELLLHGHAKDSPPGLNGLRIDGSGIIYLTNLKVQSLLVEDGQSH